MVVPRRVSTEISLTALSSSSLMIVLVMVLVHELMELFSGQFSVVLLVVHLKDGINLTTDDDETMMMKKQW